MRLPGHLLQPATFRSEPAMAAMSAIAVGMFLGAWMIGPAITRHTGVEPPAASQERVSFEEMVTRPDPLPYRAPTPAFGMSGPPNYAAAAKEKARAELGGQFADSDEPAREAPSQYRDRAPSRGYRSIDRHRVY